VLAEEARLEGTVRTISPALRERVKGLIERAVAGVCAAHGATFTLDYAFGGAPGAGPAERYRCHHPRLFVADEQEMPAGIACYLNLVTRFCAQ